MFMVTLGLTTVEMLGVQRWRLDTNGFAIQIGRHSGNAEHLQRANALHITLLSPNTSHAQSARRLFEGGFKGIWKGFGSVGEAFLQCVRRFKTLQSLSKFVLESLYLDLTWKTIALNLNC